jgi:hypothetical protein
VSISASTEFAVDVEFVTAGSAPPNRAAAGLASRKKICVPKKISNSHVTSSREFYFLQVEILEFVAVEIL